MLQLTDVAKRYSATGKQVAALDGVSMHLGDGEFAAVQGPSGCGKTTLLLICGGLLTPDAGTVVVGDTQLSTLSADQRARFRAGHIGFVFQQFHLIPYLSLLDNVLAAALPLRDPQARQRARGLIEQFGLGDRIHHTPAELSAGECQRVGLARAMLNSPDVILADEPTGNLDPESGEVVLQAFADFASRGGTVLMVTHNRDAAQRARHVVKMRAGRIE